MIDTWQNISHLLKSNSKTTLIKIFEDGNANSKINERLRRRKAGEKMSEPIRQEEQDSDQEDFLRSGSNTVDENVDEIILTDISIASNISDTPVVCRSVYKCSIENIWHLLQWLHLV